MRFVDISVWGDCTLLTPCAIAQLAMYSLLYQTAAPACLLGTVETPHPYFITYAKGMLRSPVRGFNCI